jgi:mono/diheme cytochrome c family protein
MSAHVSDVPTIPRRVHVLGGVWIAAGVLLGIGAFAWLAGMGTTQTALLSNPRPAAVAPATTARTALVERSDNRGQVLFGRYCDSCHPGGREGIGSDLEGTQVKRQYTSEERIIRFVRAGGYDMPAFGKNLISDDDLAAVAAYVHDLPAQQAR